MLRTSLSLTGQWEFKPYPLPARRMSDLDGEDWNISNVPCSIFNSLIESGQIKQSQIDSKPEKFSWVSKKPWVYRKIFDTPNDLLNCDRAELVFDGLDTIASIWLNEKLIAKTNNMFIPFRFDVTELLKPKENKLLVKFEPAVECAEKLMARYTVFNESDFSNPYRVYIRKAQYQFGWDFCPSLPGCGIWRDVRLEGIKNARISDVHIRTVDCNQQYADIKVAVKLDVAAKQKFVCKINLSSDGQKIEHSLIFEQGEDSHSTLLRIEKPSLWWPAGSGEQNLYLAKLQLYNENEIVDEIQKKFGIRTVKLNRQAEKKAGKFCFEINSQRIFAKGANWIPASIFAGSVSENDYEKLLFAAADANINMLRVWGGGYYENDKFYELCDQLGVMVWQDFMFAGGYYPDRQWFTAEVEKEAIEIITRLRNHPCLVLWCGNDQIDSMHNFGELGTSKKFHGKTIYHKLLPRLIADLDTDTDYIPTTPLAQKNQFKSGQMLTVHNWDVWRGNQPICKYICSPQDIPEFVTEFGLQSLPNLETVEKFCPDEQLSIGSWQIEKHNYQAGGNSQLYRYIGDMFGAAENFEKFVYLSQLAQGRAAKLYVEHLRANKQKNNGVLFWQFNDCCPAISFSALDYDKKPKAIYYYARRFFAKYLISILPEFDKSCSGSMTNLKSISVIVVNDSDKSLTATLNCRLLDLFGRKLDQVSLPVAIAPFNVASALKLPQAMVFPENPQQCALQVTLDKNDKRISENLFFYVPDKYINWPKTEISKSFSQVAENKWQIRLKSNVITRDVKITAMPSAQLSDNFVNLVPPNDIEIIAAYTSACASLPEPKFKLLGLSNFT